MVLRDADGATLAFVTGTVHALVQASASLRPSRLRLGVGEVPRESPCATA
jgi:hypothetical protein